MRMRATNSSAHAATILARSDRGRAEHIAIEGERMEPIEAPTKDPYRITRDRYTLSSWLHSCTTELSLLDDHYLRVHAVRSGSQPRQYQLDLRFISPRPVRIRHISWMWLAISLGLLGLAAVEIGSVWPELSVPRGSAVSAITLCVSVLTFWIFCRRTTESLQFRSEHGEVTLFCVTGGLGSTRHGKEFFIKLIKSIYAAKSVRQQLKEQLLRDEMREHHRLRGLGLLNEKEYEESKGRILAAH